MQSKIYVPFLVTELDGLGKQLAGIQYDVEPIQGGKMPNPDLYRHVVFDAAAIDAHFLVCLYYAGVRHGVERLGARVVTSGLVNADAPAISEPIKNVTNG
jgi:hypothetical protein